MLLMELLAPVGDWNMLSAAVKAGADAVYFGVKGFNMRAAAVNFSLNEVPQVVQFCHQHRIKAYCTVNIIIFQKELKKLDSLLDKLKKAQIDAVIGWDLAVIKGCKKRRIPIHLSTQASVSNSESADLWKKFGVSRIVLARECSLEDVKEIKKKSRMEIECFVHGARCISLSGRCFMSYDLFGKSANRGECWQTCRRQFKVTDEEGKEMILENNFILSAKDLCALPLLSSLIKTGVDCLKIEGRNRGADYVFKVVSAYRQALDAVKSRKFTAELQKELLGQLSEVYNKGFTRGFYVDYPYHRRSDVYGSQSAKQKLIIGQVSNYYRKLKVAEFKVESESFSLGDKLAFIGPTTGYYEELITEIHDYKGRIPQAKKGMIVSVKIKAKVRLNDKVYLIRDRKE